jgi:hypothetical protein
MENTLTGLFFRIGKVKLPAWSIGGKKISAHRVRFG